MTVQPATHPKVKLRDGGLGFGTTGTDLTLRTIPHSFAPDTLAAIDTLLDTVSAQNRVAIPLAIESGSRAWGFPSPDSDYDCRFIYVRSADQYLSPWVPRDVIETPLVGDLDVNGWDLGKALKLMLKGNAVIIEWLKSPIIYRGDAEFRDAFLALAEQHSHPTLIARHYLHLGERQRNTYFSDHKHVAIKKLFYALRPAAALRWMRVNGMVRLPPMHFPALMAECDAPSEVAAMVADLLAKKAETRELGTGLLPDAIRDFIDGEFAAARETLGDVPVRASDEARLEVGDFYRQWVGESRLFAI